MIGPTPTDHLASTRPRGRSSRTRQATSDCRQLSPRPHIPGDTDQGGSREAKDRGCRGPRGDAVGAAACGDEPTDPPPNPLDGKGKTIKVWLMVDAESGWKDVVDDANARFTAATKAQVKVEYQQWANRSPGWTPTLAGTDVPDVVELGNTDMPKYVFNGAFAEIDKSRFENSGTWLHGPVRTRARSTARPTACPTTPAPGC